MAVARQRVVAVELAEAAAEFDVLLAREFLVAQQQDAVLEKCAVDFAERLLAHVARHVDVAHFGAERVGQRPQFHCHDCSLRNDRG
jgi:hypothetical protein